MTNQNIEFSLHKFDIHEECRCSRESGIPGNLASLHTFCCFWLGLGLGLGSGFSLIDMHGGGCQIPWDARFPMTPGLCVRM